MHALVLLRVLVLDLILANVKLVGQVLIVLFQFVMVLQQIMLVLVVVPQKVHVFLKTPVNAKLDGLDLTVQFLFVIHRLDHLPAQDHLKEVAFLKILANVKLDGLDLNAQFQSVMD